MAETSRGGIKKDGQTRGGTANGRKYVKTDRKGGDAQRKEAQKETNSRGNRAKVQAGSGKGTAPAPRSTTAPAAKAAPGPTGVAKQTGTQVATQSRAVSGLSGKIAPRNPGTVAPATPRGTPAGPQGYTQSFGQPVEGMRDVGSGRSAGAANPRSYTTSAQTAPGATGAPQQLTGPARPDMTAGQRPQMSTPGRDTQILGAVGRVLARWAGPAAAAAQVMQPSSTNAGEAEWLAAGKPLGGPAPQAPTNAGGAMASPMASPMGQVAQGAPQRVTAAPSAIEMPQRAPAPASRPQAPAPAPQRSAQPAPQARVPNRPPQSKPSGLSVDDKVAQLVAKGFSPEDAQKLASAQGGKVNAPAGYAKGGMVKAPGMPRMPKTPDTGKKGTSSKVKAVAPTMSKVAKPLKAAKKGNK